MTVFRVFFRIYSFAYRALPNHKPSFRYKQKMQHPFQTRKCPFSMRFGSHTTGIVRRAHNMGHFFLENVQVASRPAFLCSWPVKSRCFCVLNRAPKPGLSRAMMLKMRCRRPIVRRLKEPRKTIIGQP